MLEKLVVMKHSSTPSVESDIRPRTLLFPFELEQLTNQLKRQPNDLEIVVFALYRSVCRHTFSTLDDNHYTIDLSTSTHALPFELSNYLTPIARYHNLLFGELEMLETQVALRTSLSQISSTHQLIPSPIVDGKIHFIKGEEEIQNNESLGLFQHINTDEIAIQEGDLIFVVTVASQDLLSAGLEISEKKGVLGVLPLAENTLIGSLTHWCMPHNIGLHLDTNKLQLLHKEINQALIETHPSRLLILCKADARSTLAEIIDDYAHHLVQIGNCVNEPSISFVNGSTVETKIEHRLLANTLRAVISSDFEGIKTSSSVRRPSLADTDMPDDLKEVAIQLLQHPTIASMRNTIEKMAYFSDALTTILPEAADATICKSEEDTLAFVSGSIPNQWSSTDELINQVLFDLVTLTQRLISSGAKPKVLIGKITLQKTQEDVGKALIQSLKTYCRSLGLTPPHINLSITEENECLLSLGSFCFIGEIIHPKALMTTGFKSKGDLIFLLGENINDISGSIYASIFHSTKTANLPNLDIQKSIETTKTLEQLISARLISAAHSCGKGGLFIALTEMAMPHDLGFDIVSDAEIREDAFLFGEAAGRVLVTVNEENEDEFLEFMLSSGLSYNLLGHVTKGKLVVDDNHFGFIQEAKDIYENALGYNFE